MSPSAPKHIIVIGAGVIGLQTAVTLLQAGYAVTVVAEHWPGDVAGEYTSPWAGAHWRTHAIAEEEELCQWDTETYRAWQEVVKKEWMEGREGRSGLRVCKSLHYWETSTPEIAQGATSLWWSSVVDQFIVIPSSELPSGVYCGVSFNAFAINVNQYLLYLLSSIEALGGKTIHARLPTDSGIRNALEKAKDLAGGPPVHAYINATGIGARHLVGDLAIEALRGQTVVVRGEASRISTRVGKTKNDIRMVIPRPGSGTSVIGVTKEPGIWDTSVNDDATQRFLRDCKELAPELLDEDGEFKALSVQVGLRPAREGGPRVEAEEVLEGGELVIHEYGHSGAGYQNSVGSANKVLRILEKYGQGRL